MIRSSRLFPLINCSLNRSLYEVCSFISLFFGVFLLLFCLLLVPDFRTRILGDWACPVSNWCTFYSNSWGAVEYWPNDHQTMLLNFFTPHHSLLLYSAFFYNPRVSWIVNLSDSNRNRCIGSRISFIYSIRLRDPPQSFVLLSFLLFFFGHALAVSFDCFLLFFFLSWVPALLDVCNHPPVWPYSANCNDRWWRMIAPNFCNLRFRRNRQ